MKFLAKRLYRTGIVAPLLIALILGACGGKKSDATPTVNTTANASAAAVATTAATAIPATATAAVATVIPSTPTPLANPTAIVATGTALSATSSAFTGTAPAGAPTNAAKPSDLQAQTLVDKARSRFDQVNAVHFALAIEGDVYLDTLRTEKLKSADGDLVRPDRVSLTAKASVGPLNAQLKFIQVGDDSYLTNILTGKWEKAPAGFAYDPRIVFDRDRGVSAIMGKVSGWSLVGSDKVNGVDTQHVRGPVPVDSVNALVSSSLRGDNVDVDLYIEGKNGDVVRFILAEQPGAVAPGTVAAKWTLDLSRQNENIKVDAPTLGS